LQLTQYRPKNRYGKGAWVDRALLLPYGIYRGPILRAEDDGVRVRAFNNAQRELNVGVAAAFGSTTDEVPLREGMPDLGILAEIGPQLIMRLGRVDPSRPVSKHPWSIELPLRTVWDLTHYRFRGITLEPRLVYQRDLPGRFNIYTTVSALVGTRRHADNFYSVDNQYSTSNRTAYQADAGLISTRLNLYLSYEVTPAVRLAGFWRGHSTSGGANDASPLIDQENGWSAGLGFAWQILKSSKRGAN